MTAHTAPKPPPPGARLIPIDFESPHERDLLHAQRVICGWKTDAIEEWREHVQEKKQVMFWIALPGNLSGIPTYKDVNTMDMPRISRAEQKEGDEDEETQEEKEKEGGNEEDRETGLKEGQEGKREREREYLPVGHINLDHEDFAAAYWGLSESCGLTEPDGSVLTLTLLFVLPTFRAFGLASFAILRLSHLARDPRYGSSNCVALTLDTLSPRHTGSNATSPENVRMWKAFGVEPEKVPRSNVGWYEKLGFRMYREDGERYIGEGEKGEFRMWARYMRLELVEGR